MWNSVPGFWEVLKCVWPDLLMAAVFAVFVLECFILFVLIPRLNRDLPADLPRISLPPFTLVTFFAIYGCTILGYLVWQFSRDTIAISLTRLSLWAFAGSMCLVYVVIIWNDYKRLEARRDHLLELARMDVLEVTINATVPAEDSRYLKVSVISSVPRGTRFVNKAKTFLVLRDKWVPPEDGESVVTIRHAKGQIHHVYHGRIPTIDWLL